MTCLGELGGLGQAWEVFGGVNGGGPAPALSNNGQSVGLEGCTEKVHRSVAYQKCPVHIACEILTPQGVYQL